MKLTKLEDIQNPNRDYSPISTPGMLQDFMETTIHSDFLNEIHIRIESMRDLNEECDSKTYLETRGAIKGLRMVAGIFENLYQNSLTDHTNKEEESNEI
jgi:hypothetical protein